MHYINRDAYETAIKHAILNIYNSIELLLKEQLAKIHPIFIYIDINKKITDDSKTVGLAEILVRMENLDIPLTREQATALQDLQKIRNRIEHHQFEKSEKHKIFVGKALKFLLEYLPNINGDKLEEIIDDEDNYRTVIDAILSYEERIRKALVDARVEAYEIVICPYCEEDTLAIETSRGNYCFFCLAEVDVVQCDYCGTYIHPDDESFGSCSNCLPERLRRF